MAVLVPLCQVHVQKGGAEMREVNTVSNYTQPHPHVWWLTETIDSGSDNKLGMDDDSKYNSPASYGANPWACYFRVK